MELVCDSIFVALEGIKNYTKYEYASDFERNAYLDMFDRCQIIVKNHDLKPEAMLQALSDLHTSVTAGRIVEPFFSYARWFYNRNEVREEAVITAFTMVDSICKRFLS
jgi:hypothetical protein